MKQVYIFSEGKTEICYFKQLKSVKDLQEMKIPGKEEGQLSGIDRSSLKKSQDRLYKIISGLSRGDYSKTEISDTNSKIFYLLDIDGFNTDAYSQESVDFIRKNFEDKNITVLFSNKDIELWILLHLCDYKKEDGKYIEKILKESGHIYGKGGKQNNVEFFQKIIGENLHTAIENAKKLEKYQDKKEHIKYKNPYTEVYKIFDELNF